MRMKRGGQGEWEKKEVRTVPLLALTLQHLFLRNIQDGVGISCSPVTLSAKSPAKVTPESSSPALFGEHDPHRPHGCVLPCNRLTRESPGVSGTE